VWRIPLLELAMIAKALTTSTAVEMLIELGLTEVESLEELKPGFFYVASPTRIEAWFSGGHKIRATLEYDRWA
jgi:hypothetical protein